MAHRTPRLLLALGTVATAAMLTLAACGGGSTGTPTPFSLGGGSQIAGFTSTPTPGAPQAQVTAKLTVKPGESPTAAPTSAPTSAGTPASDPAVAAGRTLISTLPCGACHTIDSIPAMRGAIGPNLTHAGSEAATRKPGTDAAAYMRESIVNPGAFIAPNFPNAMPPGLVAEGKDLDNLVAYLLSLK